MNSIPVRLALAAFLIVGAVTANAQPANPTAAGTPPPGLPTPAQSSSPATPQNPSQSTQGGLMSQDKMTGTWDNLRKTLTDDGFKLSPTYIGEVFANPSGGNGQGIIDDGLLNLALDLDFDKMSGGEIADLTLHANALEIHGAGLSPAFVGDFSNTSNIAAFNTLRLQELWVQKLFWDKKLSIKAGNIAVDTEFFQSASASLFINATFGAFTLFANNLRAPPAYPLASPGIRFQLAPDPRFYVMAGVFGADNNSNPATNNQNGTRFALTAGSGLLAMSEAGYLLNQAPNDQGLQGTYRIGSFVQTANYTTWSSQARAALGTGSLQSAGSDFGIYGVLDQQLYVNQDQIVSLFVRSGSAPSNTNFVDYYADGGFNFTGFIPGRKADVIGLGVGRSHVSHDYSDSQTALGDAPSTAETLLEATYFVQVAPWWSVQPDFQYIITPGGEQGAHNATVLGLRTTIAF